MFSWQMYPNQQQPSKSTRNQIHWNAIWPQLLTAEISSQMWRGGWLDHPFMVTRKIQTTTCRYNKRNKILLQCSVHRSPKLEFVFNLGWATCGTTITWCRFYVLSPSLFYSLICPHTHKKKKKINPFWYWEYKPRLNKHESLHVLALIFISGEWNCDNWL